MFYSTRRDDLFVSASTAILEGLAPDGGLYLPQEIPGYEIHPEDVNLSYDELAYRILRLYLDDFTDEEIRDSVSRAYGKENFPQKVLDVVSFQDQSFLELFHGNTLTFKDMALSLLPHLLKKSMEKHPERKKIHILTATSGDTGSAVLSAFSSLPDIRVSILYPDKGVAPIQEMQMLYFTDATKRAYAYERKNFDDCQNLVKEILGKRKEGSGLTSANSINIGRLLPQIVYYYAAYLKLVKNNGISFGETIDVVVPTGNFGDIFAAYLAKKMGLPLGRLVIASNRNRILTDFLKTGIYSLDRPFYKTESPSMDILISSNFERLLYLSCKDSKKVRDWMKELKEKKSFQVDEETLKVIRKDFVSYSASEEETQKAILECYQKNHYLIDPHTAVGYHAYESYRKEETSRQTLVVATASPLKFSKTVAKCIGIDSQDDLDALRKLLSHDNLELPYSLKKVLSSRCEKYVIHKRQFEDEVKGIRHLDVRTPATSANLGSGFDCCGMALKLYNTYRFTLCEKDCLSKFAKEFSSCDNNLVLRSYRYFFEKLNLPYQPVKIELLKQEVPESRGLGSSSCCIVSGLVAANRICHNRVSKQALLQMAIDLEGHPDNVTPCLFGGLIACYRKPDSSFGYFSHPIHPSLHFLLVIPQQKMNTERARSVLKDSYSREDVVFNISSALHTLSALEHADMEELNVAFRDKIHVPYRLPLIQDGEKVKALAESHSLPFTISGSGSTLILAYKNHDISAFCKELKAMVPEMTVKKADYDIMGVYSEVIYES